MIEDGFLGGVTWIGRIKKRCDRDLCRAETFRRGTAYAEEQGAEEESDQGVLEGTRHNTS
jgi:hypothetical protein